MQQPIDVNLDKTISPVDPPLTLKEVATLLVKHYGIHDGKYDLIVEFQIGVGNVGPTSSPSPGAMVGISRIGLSPSKEIGPLTIDAAEVNPSTKIKKRK